MSTSHLPPTPLAGEAPAPAHEAGRAGPSQRAFRLGQRISAACFWVAFLTTAVSCVLWALAPAARCDALARLIRPNAALGGLSCAAALGIKRWRQAGRLAAAAEALLCLTAAALGGAALLAMWVEPPLIKDALCASKACQGVARIAPVAALALIATGIAIWSQPAGARGQGAPLSAWLSFGVALTCAGFLLAAAFQHLDPRPSPPATVIMPLASLSLFLINLGLLALGPGHGFMAEMMGDDRGSQIARRLFRRWLLTTLMIGFLGVHLRKEAVVPVEEGTALLIIAAMVILGSTTYEQAKRINRLLRDEASYIASLKAALTQGEVLTRRLAMEKGQLEGLLRAAERYSIIAVDLDNTITTFNHGAELMLGYPADEVVGKTTPALFHDGDELAARARELGVPPGMDVFNVLPKSGICDNRAWTYICRDGRRLPVWLTVSAVYDPQGAPVGYVGIARDLSEDKRKERQRDGFLLVGQELLCAVDMQGCIESVSPSFRRILGYDPEALIGKHFKSFVHPHDVESTSKAFNQIVEGLALQRFENRWRAKDGSFRWISWDASPPNDDGTVYAGGWDITADKLRDRERQRLLEFEQQMIGIVSHDLRSPIHAVALSAQLLQRRTHPPERVRSVAARIADAATRAEGLVHDLLDFTQARLGGGLPVAPTAVDVAALVHAGVADLRLLHPRVQFDVKGATELPFIADGPRLLQAVGNLVSNAVTYGDGRVRIAFELLGGALQLTVHNGGAPIAPGVLPHLFEPLRRGTGPEGNSGRSLGLGLYIVSEVARAHGGTVEVESSQERGTLFRLLLPQPVPGAWGTARARAGDAAHPS